MSGQVHAEQTVIDQEGQPARPARRRTIEQKRAEHAANAITRDLKSKSQLDTYAKFVRKVPSMLTTQGLGQTVAYLSSKARDSNKNLTIDGLVLQHLREWLTSPDDLIGWPKGDDEEFRAQIAQCDNATYYLALGEAITYVGWLKRLSQAHLLEWNDNAAGSESQDATPSTEQRAPSEMKASANA